MTEVSDFEITESKKSPVSIKPAGDRPRRARSVSELQQQAPSDPSQKFIPEFSVVVENLPSGGVFYPSGVSIKYKTYSFGEVQKASTSSANIAHSVQLAVDGITTEGMPKDRLTLFDALYLGIMRKISSMGELKFEMPFICRGCGQQTKGIFTHKDINFRDLPEEVVPPIEAEVGGRTLQFAPMTVRQFLDLHGGRYNPHLVNGKIDKTAIYATMIKNLDFKDAIALLSVPMSPDDLETLSEIDKLLVHDVQPLEVICKMQVTNKAGEKVECGTQNALKLEGREALLRPFRDGEAPARARIRFGSKQSS